MVDLKEIRIFDNIPFEPDMSFVINRLRFHFPNQLSQLEEIWQDLVARVVPITQPKDIYKISNITGKAQDSIEIDGVKFANYLLRVNLGEADKVFLFAATCGQETDLLPVPDTDEIRSYCLEILKEMALASAIRYLRDYLVQSFKLEYLWSLGPGEFQAWPITHQPILISLFQGKERLIGIKPQADGSLLPTHSRSGIFYYFAADFENCVFCDQISCMFRRAPNNPELAAKYPERVRKGCAR